MSSPSTSASLFAALKTVLYAGAQTAVVILAAYGFLGVLGGLRNWFKMRRVRRNRAKFHAVD